MHVYLYVDIITTETFGIGMAMGRRQPALAHHQANTECLLRATAKILRPVATFMESLQGHVVFARTFAQTKKTISVSRSSKRSEIAG